jgi:hypothetical protein
MLSKSLLERAGLEHRGRTSHKRLDVLDETTQKDLFKSTGNDPV